MNYRYGDMLPLFEGSDYQAAKDFMVGKYMRAQKDDSSSSIVIMAQDENGNTVPPESVPDSLLQQIIESSVTYAFGKNLWKIANFHKVQDTFVNKYQDSILNFLAANDIDARIISFQPIAAMGSIIIESLLSTDNTISHWNPNEDWDFYYTDDVSRNRMNPMNTLQHVTIEVAGVTNRDFIKSIYPDKYEAIFENLDNGKSITANIKILPSSNYEGILSFVNTIHRCF